MQRLALLWRARQRLAACFLGAGQIRSKQLVPYIAVQKVYGKGVNLRLS